MVVFQFLDSAGVSVKHRASLTATDCCFLCGLACGIGTGVDVQQGATASLVRELVL